MIDRLFMYQGAIASVALSHDEGCSCDACKASHGDDAALARVIDSLEVQILGRPRWPAGDCQRLCECRPHPEQQTRTDLFIWRRDPRWWSCMSCDGRVRALTDSELQERGPGYEQ